MKLYKIAQESLLICMDCKQSTVGYGYRVHDDLWQSVVPDSKGELCIPCLEKRLGRKLNTYDFDRCLFNFGEFMKQYKNPILIDRIGEENFWPDQD